MLRIVCVQHGNYLGRGSEYVNILVDQIRRNLKAGTEGEFVCFTDDPSGLSEGITARPIPEGLQGWWGKLWLFSPNLFPEGDQIVFFDLDTLIVGSLDELVAWRGEFAILQDFYRPNGLQSSVMSWRSGFGHDIWRQFDLSGRPEIQGGDQAWIERIVRQPFILQNLFPKTFVSYKRHCQPHPPKGAKVIIFHGLPRPHECSGWVKSVWKEGGVGATEIEVIHNEEKERIRENITYALSAGLPELVQTQAHNETVCIVGGGPTASDFLAELAARKQNGHKIWALNGAGKWLVENGITPDALWILDARPFNSRFVLPDVKLFASSQCHKTVLQHPNTTLYHDYQCGPLLPSGKLLIGGGTTVGMKALAAAHTMGYRSIHLYGIDCCVKETHHAYPQQENDGEIVLSVNVGDKVFQCQPWMFQQAEDFQNICAAIVEMGSSVYVHGDSLLAEVAKCMAQPGPADYRAHSILSRLPDGPVKGAEIGVFGADLSSRLLLRENLSLYMVDPWEGNGASYAVKEGDFHENLTQEQQDSYYEMSLGKTDFASDRRKVIRMRSVEAAKQVADGELDFVFIDGDHSYEGCKSDIEAWFSKVKSGGLVCGHDYMNEDCPFPGVDKAVNELPFPVERGDNFTWFIRRP